MSKITTETEKFGDENKSAEAMFYLEQAAKTIKPAGTDYIGTFTVHVYQQRFAMKEEVLFASQFIGKVPEQFAVEANKELTRQMLTRYGHDPKKVK